MGLWDEHLGRGELQVRYLKFRKVTFQLVPVERWPSLF